MKKIETKFNVPYSALKWLAIICMTYDHVLKHIFDISAQDLILFPGRFAFPLFAFIIAKNLAKYEIFKKYILRMAPFAIISFFVDHYFFEQRTNLNILITLISSISIIWVIYLTKKINNKYFHLLYIIEIALLSIIIGMFVDYGIIGIWLIPALYIYFKKPDLIKYIVILIMVSSLMPNLLFGILIIPFVAWLLLVEPVPSKKRGSFKKTGWLFYAYFPAHKLVIALIRDWMS